MFITIQTTSGIVETLVNLVINTKNKSNGKPTKINSRNFPFLFTMK